MIVYYTLLLLLILSSYLEVVHNKQYGWWWIIVISIIFIVGFRYEVGSDWFVYVLYYNKARPDVWDAVFNGEFEPVYMVLMLTCKSLGLSSQFFLSVVSMISIGVLIFAIKKMNGQLLRTSFLIYFCLHFFHFQLNMIRHGIAASIIFLSLYYISGNKVVKFLLCVFCASLFHKSSIVFLILYFVVRQNYSKKTIIIMIAGAFLIYMYVGMSGVLDVLPLFQDKIDYYLNDYYGGHIEDFSYGVSLGLLFLCFLSLYSRFGPLNVAYVEKPLFRVLINTTFIAFILGLSLNQIPIIIERYVSILNTTIIVLFPLLMNGFKEKRRRLAVWYVIVLYCILLFSKNLSLNPDTKTNQFLPYKMKIL